MTDALVVTNFLLHLKFIIIKKPTNSGYLCFNSDGKRSVFFLKKTNAHKYVSLAIFRVLKGTSFISNTFLISLVIFQVL